VLSAPEHRVRSEEKIVTTDIQDRDGIVVVVPYVVALRSLADDSAVFRSRRYTPREVARLFSDGSLLSWSCSLAAPGSWQGGEEKLREGVNYGIDAIAAALQRLLDLPLIGVFAISLGVACTLLVVAQWSMRGTRRPRTTVALRIVAGLFVVAATLLALDRRLDREEERRDAERERATSAAMALLETLQQHGVPRERLGIDLDAARAALQRSFQGVVLRGVVLDEATDLVLFTAADPFVSGALATVDLRVPTVKIEINADFAEKSLTSEFGRARACTVAINGEAGMSPGLHCGLGKWCGNMVIEGRRVQREAADVPRPFLGFDAANHARFVASDAKARTVEASDVNVIWGRADSIVGGDLRRAPLRWNQPRTVMGIDRDGNRLFLLVVDGRQPRRSVGFTAPQVADFLQAFAVHDAMFCDEGGSACMYVGAMLGLVTKPSDNHGEERPTYTHFGISSRRASGH
jgi:hypothetical protein